MSLGATFPLGAAVVGKYTLNGVVIRVAPAIVISCSGGKILIQGTAAALREAGWEICPPPPESPEAK